MSSGKGLINISVIGVFCSGLEKCKELFKTEFQMEVSESDCEVVRQVCEAVSTRAARLAGAGIVALVEKIGKISSCSVAVDGSLYKKHPKFSQRYSCTVVI